MLKSNLQSVFIYNVIILIAQLQSHRTINIYSDTVPFVYYSQQIILKQYGGPNPLFNLIDYSSKNFQNIPKIVIGIVKYDNLWNPQSGISFQLSATPVTKTSANIQVVEENSSKYDLSGISVSVVAIDTQQFPYLDILQLQQTNLLLLTGSSTLLFSENRNFSSSISGLSGIKNVAVFLTGWKSGPQNSSNTLFTLSISVQNITPSGYQVLITSNSSSQQIIKVYYTVVEYITNPSGTQYTLITNQDLQYQSAQSNISFKCFYTTPSDCPNSNRYFQVLNTLQKAITNYSNYPQGSQQNFLVSINQFDFQCLSDNMNPRISIEKMALQSATSIQYSYYVWDGSTCNGSISSFLFFYTQTDCKNLSSTLPQTCLDCQASSYFLSDKQTCVSSTPDGYYCTTQSLFFTCQNCNISNCQICSLLPSPSTSFTCTQCITGYFLLNGICFSTQPNQTFCDNQKKCTLCSDTNCKTCTDTNVSPSLCISCQNASYYFYKGQCFKPSSLPPITYCDSKLLTCKDCKNKTCQYCQSDQNTCTQCNSLYFFTGQCTITQPDKTYCDTQQVCTSCPLSLTNCRYCSDPNITPVQCNSCLNSSFLYNNTCSLVQPDNTFCDAQQICYKCSDVNCKSCTDPTNTPQVCLKCQDSTYYLYNGKCYSPTNQPPNTYCDSSAMTCINCSQDSCQKCSPDKNTCIECTISQYLLNGSCSKSQPPKTYCDSITLKCTLCQNPNCLTCSNPNVSLSQCITCQNYFLDGDCFDQQPDNTFCNSQKICSQCSDIKCKVCSDPTNTPQICVLCQDPRQYLFNGQCVSKQPLNTYCDTSLICNQCTNQNCQTCGSDLKTCLSCIDSTTLQLQNNCQCTSPGSFYNQANKSCSGCKLEFCLQCSIDGVSCLQCQNGFVLRSYPNSKLCKYCGVGHYSDANNKCVNPCVKECDLCTDNKSCAQFKDGHIFKSPDCHYSCSQCLVQGQPYQCVQCSSPTREFEEITQSCPCKSGYKDQGQADCVQDNSSQMSQSLQSTSESLVKVSYVMYLPQLFINIHPFSDSFIFSMQQLGNLYFANPNSTAIPYQSLTIMNFFNIYYQTTSQNNNTLEYVLGIKYKTIIDTQISQNLIILGIALTIFSFLALIIYVLRSKLTNRFFANNLLWNCQMKLIRVSSNYFLVNVFLNLSNFQQMSPISSAILGILIAIYFVNCLVSFQKSKYPDTEKFRYLHENLNTYNTFHKYFWLILEIKKFALIVCLSFIQVKLYPYIILGTTFIFAIILGKYKPSADCLRDSVYLIIGELFVLVLSLFPLVIEQSKDEQQQLQMLNFANITLIVYVIFQMIVSLEFVIRKILIYRKEKSLYKSKNKSQQPIVMDRSYEINFEKLDDFLNSSQRYRSDVFKKKKTTITTTRSTNNYF